jgi:serine/threonine protein kinase
MGGDVRPGTVFAGHRIERVIGRGGVSVVYLAEHLQLGRKVALKVLFPHLADDPAFRDRFIRESRTAAELDHPNIVTVFDAGEVDGLLYLSMRYIDGSDLEEVVAEQGSLDPWRAVTIVSMVAAALDVAHDEGLVHRDVKPGNILLSRPGSPLERAYLADFGITKRIATVTTQGALTRTGQFVGTVDYVAPEQIQGEVVDGRADVYSLGCVLFRCLTGDPPFPRPADVATIYAHLHDAPPALPLDAPAGMDDVIGRALAKARNDRYATCEALAEAARSHLDRGIATEILPTPDPWQRVGTRARPGRWRWSIAVAILALVIIATLVWVGAASRDGPSVGASLSPPPSSSAPSNPHGILWSSFEWDPTPGPERAAMLRATNAPDGTIIAAGHADGAEGEDAVVWVSNSQTDWDEIVLPGGGGPGNQRVSGIVTNRSRVVAVGYDGGDASAWYSDDGGRNWRRAPVPGGDSAQFMTGVAVTAEGNLLAFGAEQELDGSAAGIVWTSVDGSRWRTVRPAAFREQGTRFASAATGAGGDLVAVGRALGPDGSIDAAVWQVHDGTWTQEDPAVFTVPGEQLLTDVDVAGDVTVAVGYDASVNEPVVWSRDRSGRWSKGEFSGIGTEGRLSAVVDLGGTLIAAGWSSQEGNIDAATWRSTDGVSWQLLDNQVMVDDLGGDGYQAIRTLLIHGKKHIYAFGGSSPDSQSEDLAQAQLWNGTVQ